MLDYVKDFNKEHSVILMGFSGLRFDSLHRGPMPNLFKLSKDGVLVYEKINAFQTETLPSFHTLSTGLYPKDHGLIGNRMKDLSAGSMFDVGNTDSKWWGAVEPIWLTNQRSNNSKSALCFWPGHDVSFGGRKASFTCDAYGNGTKEVDPFIELTKTEKTSKPVMSFVERMKKVMGWVKLKERPTFIAVYFEEPLKTAIRNGTDSKEYKESLVKLDNLIGKFVQDLKDEDLLERINLVITGESGAVDIKKDSEIYLEDHLSADMKETYDVINKRPIMGILPHDLKKTSEFFKKLNSSHPHMKVYLKDQLTGDFHYKHENRTMPITLVADEGFRIHAKRIADPNDIRKAFMGYPGSIKSTHALFVAHGPAFRKHIRLPKIQNVDVYQLLCSSLKIEPNQHQGSGYVFAHLIAQPEKWYWHIAKTVAKSKPALTGVIVLFVVLLFGALYLLIHVIYNASVRCRCRKRKKKTTAQNSKNKTKESEGRTHLLSDEEELSGTDLGSDLDSDLEVRYVQS